MPASGEGSYCSPGQFVNFYDERSVRQLLSDDEVPVTGSLSDNVKLAGILMAASGRVESAATLGGRYKIDETRNDLAALAGNSAEFLAELVAALAFFRLWMRRPNVSVKLPPECEEAEDFLERLRLGERVFGNAANQAAAVVDSEVEDAAQVLERHGIVTEAQRFFGTRNNRLHG